MPPCFLLFAISHFCDASNPVLFTSADRLPTSVSSQSGTEFGRITFEFETVCVADCELFFMMVGINGIRQEQLWGFVFLP